jgi:hypothetical protein
MPTFNTDTPKPGYVYDSSDDTWYPLAGIAVQSLDGLSDVVISTAASGQTLVYNGTNWVNTAETGDVSAVSAGTGITVTNGTGPIPSVAIDSTVTTLTGTQTLTNKTLTTPTINGGTITATGGTVVIHGIVLPATHGISFEGTTDDLNETVLVATDPTADRTVSLPDATTTLVGTDTTDTLTNKTLTNPIFIAPEERLTVTAASATGTINIDTITSGTLYYTNSASSNHVINVRHSSNTSLNNVLTTGDSITVVWLNTNGATAFYPTVLTVDGATSAVSVKWQGGTAPTAGNASSIDAYVYNIIKTAATSYTVLASQTKFA